MNSIRRRIILIGILTCTMVSTVTAQSVTPQVLANAGAYFQNGLGSIAFTIGEPVNATLSAGTVVLTQGFHQPDADFTTAIPTMEPTSQSGIVLYPNPAREQVFLLTTGIAPGAAYTLYDGLGKRIAQHNVLDERTTIDLMGYAAGNYLLRVTDSNGALLDSFTLIIAN